MATNPFFPDSAPVDCQSQSSFPHQFPQRIPNEYAISAPNGLSFARRADCEISSSRHAIRIAVRAVALAFRLEELYGHDSPRRGDASSSRSAARDTTPPFQPGPPEPASKVWINCFGFYLILLNIILFYLLFRLWPGTVPVPDGVPGQVTIIPFYLHRQLWPETRYMCLVAIAGALGGYIHLSTSFVDYLGNRRFYSSWKWWYGLRPFIGSSLAILVYFAARGGLVAGANGAATLPPWPVWQVCSPNKPPISCEKCSIPSLSQPIPPSAPNRSTLPNNIPRSGIRCAIGCGALDSSWSRSPILFRPRVDATFLQCYARAAVSNDACAPST